MQTLSALPRRGLLGMALSAVTIPLNAKAQPGASDDPWIELAPQIFDDQPLADGQTVLAIDAPYRAEDAAVVPITIRGLVPSAATNRIVNITLVIDQNPAPLAARFTLGENSGIDTISTRVRVDSYTKIHAVAKMSDDRLYVVERFVKAAGGCSAPVAKQEADSIPLGTMRFRQFNQPATETTREAQLLIRHPNFSGLQMDQLSRLYVPAHFVAGVRIWQGNDLLLAIESGIALSENPEFRFNYHPNGATGFRAEVDDSTGQTFKDSWSVARA